MSSILPEPSENLMNERMKRPSWLVLACLLSLGMLGACLEQNPSLTYLENESGIGANIDLNEQGSVDITLPSPDITGEDAGIEPPEADIALPDDTGVGEDTTAPSGPDNGPSLSDKDEDGVLEPL